VAYALLLDSIDPWVDRIKVRDRIDQLLEDAGGTTGPASQAAERAMLMLAGGAA